MDCMASSLGLDKLGSVASRMSHAGVVRREPVRSVWDPSDRCTVGRVDRAVCEPLVLDGMSRSHEL